MEAKYILRQQGKTDPVVTLAIYDSRFPSRKFFYSTKENLDSDQWRYDEKKEKGKKRRKVTGFPKDNHQNLHLINHLDKLSLAVQEWGKTKTGLANDFIASEIADLRNKLDAVRGAEQKQEQVKEQNESDFFKIWQKIIDTTKGNNGEKISANTRLSKNQTLNLVTKYCVEKGIKLSFDSIDMDFYHSFDAYMDTQGLSPNSKGKHIKEIKSILREAVDRDISVNNSFTKKSFKVIRKETDNTYLTEAELKRMLSIKYSPSKEALRDLFVMACFTGLRHSDWHQIKKENIVIQSEKQFLKIKQKKTTDDIHIPLHPIVKILLNKYNGMPPRVISNQKFNDALKEICKHDDLKLGNVIINGESVLKAEQISTHSARRSFATNAYLSKSMSVYSIMSCTGHKTESSFLKYLKLSGLDKAVDIADSKFFSDAGWTNLKVA